MSTQSTLRACSFAARPALLCPRSWGVEEACGGRHDDRSMCHLPGGAGERERGEERW